MSEQPVENDEFATASAEADSGDLANSSEDYEPEDDDGNPMDFYMSNYATATTSSLMANNTDNELLNVPTPYGIPQSFEQYLQLQLNSCIICGKVPFTKLYQCQNGHLFCAGCYQIRVLDKMLGADVSTCPRCHVRIFRRDPTRNLVAERTIAQEQVGCERCFMQMSRGNIRQHSQYECQRRLVKCKYERIGCPYRDVVLAALAHEQTCEWRQKTGTELLEALRLRQKKREENLQLSRKLVALMQLPRITVRLLQVLPREASTFPFSEYVPVAGFRAFNQNWSVLLMWELSEDWDQPVDMDMVVPSGGPLCSLLFKLQLECPANSNAALVLSYTLVSGTYLDVKFPVNLCDKFKFSAVTQSGPATLLYQNSRRQCHKLLHERGIFARMLLARI